MEKIVIIGANHGGTAAINTILTNYPNKKVVVFDKNSNVSFLGCGMALWIGKQIDSPEGLFYSSKEKLENNGAKVYMETEVFHIDYINKLVYGRDKNGNEIIEDYDKLILSTGSLPIDLNIPGSKLENVQFVKLYQHAEDVIKKLENKKIKNIVVVGAGYIGVELAEAFKRCEKNVTLVDLASSSLTGYYDENFRDLMNENLKNHGINLRFSERLLKLEGNENNQVTKVITDKNEYDVDMVILAVGFIPNSKLAQDHLKLFKNNAILVDSYQQTSDQDVYAIGDCGTIYDNAIEDVNYIALATNAVRTGIVAAHNACGTELKGIGVQGSNGISIFGLNMVSTGLTYERALKLGFDAEYVEHTDLQKPGFIKNNNDVTLRIVYDKISRRILGAQIASKEDISMGIHVFSLAIQEKVTIDKFKLLDIFFLPHFNQPYNYFTMAALGAK
ncbi:MAG: FAD-dependent oxidoreductase [Cetobacterium sp.]|nr:FAD-dependent oxidoreductase [Cetobacterium sp.]